MTMEIIQFELGDSLACLPDLILCLGFFDGVHIGHQCRPVIRRMRKRAGKNQRQCK